MSSEGVNRIGTSDFVEPYIDLEHKPGHEYVFDRTGPV